MYKKILVPLDGTHRAEAILPHVEALALHSEARVVLMQVLEPGEQIAPQGAEFDERPIKRAENRAEEYLKAKQGEFREKGIHGKHFVEYGPIAEMIVIVAEREGADMIAMSTRARRGLSAAFHSSVATKVLNQVNIPLLLLRSEIKE